MHGLRGLGYDAFYDEELTGGGAWWVRLLDEIEQCEVFTPVLSAPYLSSEPCLAEAEYAHSLGKLILPVAIGDVDNRYLRDYIAEAQWVRYAPNDMEALFALRRAIDTLDECPPLPSPMPERPRVPISYLGTLKERVESPESLDLTTQVQLLADLRKRVAGADHDAVCGFIQTFAARTDLVVWVADEARALLTETPKPMAAADAPTAPSTESRSRRKAKAEPLARQPRPAPPRSAPPTQENVPNTDPLVTKPAATDMPAADEPPPTIPKKPAGTSPGATPPPKRNRNGLKLAAALLAVAVLAGGIFGIVKAVTHHDSRSSSTDSGDGGGGNSGHFSGTLGTWSAPTVIDRTYTMNAVSCTSATQCMASDDVGDTVGYNGTTWSRFDSIDGNASLTDVSCGSATYCKAIDLEGNVMTYDGSSWNKPTSLSSRHATAVSCAS